MHLKVIKFAFYLLLYLFGGRTTGGKLRGSRLISFCIVKRSWCIPRMSWTSWRYTTVKRTMTFHRVAKATEICQKFLFVFSRCRFWNQSLWRLRNCFDLVLLVRRDKCIEFQKFKSRSTKFSSFITLQGVPAFQNLFFLSKTKKTFQL